MLRVRASTSTNTGRAPTSSTTLAVATQDSGVVITSSPGPDAGQAQADLERGGAGAERAHRAPAAVARERRLEGAHLRPAR